MLKQNDLVIVKSVDNRIRKINRVLPHPFFPSWLVKPNYLVRIFTENRVFKRKELTYVSRETYRNRKKLDEDTFHLISENGKVKVI